MLGNTWNTEWLNSNAVRNYPLMDGADGIDQSGLFTLPDDFLVDFKLTIHNSGDIDITRFYISAIDVFGTSCVIKISYLDATDTVVEVAEVAVVQDVNTKNQIYTFNGSEDSTLFFDASGTLVVGSVEKVYSHSGAYIFELVHTRLLPTTIVSDVRAITGVRVKGATGDLSELFQGDLILAAGANITLAIVADPDTGKNMIKISAAPNNDYLSDCLCDGNPLTNPILTINEQIPDENGNINIVSLSDCLTITNDTNIKLEDTCSQPCCGCEELEVITEQLVEFKKELQDLERYAQSLQNAADQIRMVISLNQTGGV